MQSNKFRATERQHRDAPRIEVARESSYPHSNMHVDEDDNVADMVDEGMDDMMDALFTHTHIGAHVMSKLERVLRDLHTCPLWEGASMSKL